MYGDPARKLSLLRAISPYVELTKVYVLAGMSHYHRTQTDNGDRTINVITTTGKETAVSTYY